ncbi:CD109 antigen-like isoform X4 [Styela clava]
MKLLATLSLLLIATQAAVGENTYSIFLPKYVRPMTPFAFDVEIIKSENPVRVTATLESDDGKFDANLITVINSGSSQRVVLEPIPADYDGPTDFLFSIIGEDTVTGKTLFQNKTKKNDISFQKKFVSIFIQTDKAIYQPGHTIKFRGVVTTPDLTPLMNADGTTPTVTYKLADPMNNVILMESDVALSNGVAGSEFKLGRYATLGDWRITYKVYAYEESITVSVEEYKLPKFKVEIKTDQSFLHPGSMKLTGEVEALFTFGQPVKGSGRIEFTIDRWVPRGQKPNMILEKFADFDGTASFSVNASDIEKILKWNPKYGSSPLKITAFVKDKNTGDEFNATTSVDLHSKRMKVEAIAKPEFIKAGLPYVAYLKVSEQDGTLLSEDDRENLDMIINVEYTYRWNWRPFGGNSDGRREPKKMSVPLQVGKDGIAMFKITADASDFQRVNFQVKILSYPNKDEYWTSWGAEPFKSPSNTFIQVSTDDTTLTVGDKASLTIYTTEEADSYRFTILARGKLLKQELYTPAEYVKETDSFKFSYMFDVTKDMSPNVYVIVSFIRSDGEIVADSVKITVQATLENKVTMTTSTAKTDAGMPVSITVNAAAGSFVGLRAIDQSVLLLKSGNDITKDKIFQDLDKYGASSGSIGWGGGWGRWWWPYPIGGADVSEVFDNSGILVLTDALVYSSKPDYDFGCPFCGGGIGFGGGAGGGRPIRLMSFSAKPAPLRRQMAQSSSVPKTRSYFPESWIWAKEEIGDDGSTTFTYNTPDTITTWELSSFAVSDKKGLGVTDETSKITVFRNFFISLNLPPTMIRGETLNMKTTLFNYFDDELTVTLTLKENEWYDLVIPGDDPIAAGPIRTVTIPSKDSVTVVFPITFKKVGTARISVSATSPRAGDAVERTMVVKPEGIQKIESHSSIIDKETDDGVPESVTFNVNIPEDAVEGSARVKFSVSGNILGSALSNLGNLLQMPSGCGEQTMVGFAPDVYISLYLKKVGELEGKIKQKSESHIREGYTNELRYQRDDGSFSAFGSEDRSGSTWLTAFVAKCFIAAKELNSDLIEESKVNRAINFILKQQNKDGTFNEPGRVIHKDMQGGVDSKETLSSYMLIALSEGNWKKNEDVEAAMKKTQTYLESRIESVRDLYTLSIMGYALSLVESIEAPKILNIIDSMSTVKANMKFWEKKTTGMSKCEARKEYCPMDDDKPSTASIETTAYVLLTYVKMGREDIMPIVRWLVEQRGAFGGYHSTQDTVMAIQALSTVAGLFSERTMNLDIKVTHSGDENFEETFQLSDSNQIVLQMAQLPAVSGDVIIEASGQGFGDVQVTVWYNLPVGPRSDDPFIVEVDVKEQYQGEIVNLQVCSRINEDRTEVVEGTGMFVITAALPSGYTIDDKEATRENRQLKLVELDGDQITGYFDELPKGRTICMLLKLRRYAEVTGVKPQLIEVMDYYEPAKKATAMYAPPEEEGGNVCATCGEKCIGCPPKSKPKPIAREFIGKSYCRNMKFPCPDFIDGLYYDTGSHIYKMMMKYPNDSKCAAPNDAENSQKYMGLPGTLFNGVNQYIECGKTDYFEKMLSGSEGFTISILVYPTELNKPKFYVVYSFAGRKGTKPTVIFAKRPRVDQYWLKIRLNGYEYMVRSIYTYDIRLNEWTLITARLNGEKSADLFINGIKMGKSTRNERTNQPMISDITLKIGRSHIGGGRNRGNWKGLVSSLDMWSKPLTDEQIMELYNYYDPVMSSSNPMLRKSRVHHVVPMSIRHCFTRSYGASDLKSRSGQLRTSCDEPNGEKNMGPPVDLGGIEILAPPPVIVDAPMPGPEIMAAQPVDQPQPPGVMMP